MKDVNNSRNPTDSLQSGFLRQQHICHPRKRVATRLVALFLSLGLIVLHSPSFGQSFSVNAFSPWAGYGIPNGIWLTGDFNGDGKTDIFHAVANTDYANIWLSKGDGTYSVTSFSPWAGYGIPNGIWLVGDFNGDGKADIFHAVANTDYANIWISKGDGTFSVSSFSPWPGYGIPNGIWLTGDFNGDGKTDVLHAVSNTDYANIWTSNGNSTFSVTAFSPWPGYGITSGTLLAGDFNGDGKTDIFHAVANTDYANIWTSTGNGNFTVNSFSPWPGYGISDGLMLTGDFNGDGKTDILHAVTNTDYANIWTSNGNGSFTVNAFSPWPGYGIPNGVWLTGDFDADGKTDVFHAVAGTDYANIWKSNGGGTFTVHSFSPWAGYGISDGQFLVADINGDKKMDLVHAVSGTDYVNNWVSVLPAPGQFAVDGIEVTQAIQDMAHDVPLIAGKTTWARVYLNYASSTPKSVVGNITALNPATGATIVIHSPVATVVDPSLNWQLRPKRESITGSLNFPLPAGYTIAGPRTFTVTALSDPSSNTLLSCSNCSAAGRDVNFVNSSPMRVRIIGLEYPTGTPPNVVQNPPQPIDFTLLKSWLTRAYPIGQLISSEETIPAADTWPFTCDQSNAQLTALRNLEVGNGTVDSRTHYIALVSNAGGYMRGCSSLPGFVSSSPTGPTNGGLLPVNIGTDNDGSFGDWYGGHELAHSYDRFHPGFCNGNSADDPSFPYPNGQLSTNDGNYTGLDVGDAGNSIPATVLPGAADFDIMTYCNQPQWLSSYTYKGVMSWLNQENPAGNGAPGAGGPIPTLILRKLPMDPICDCPIKVVVDQPKRPAITVALNQAPVLTRGDLIKQPAPKIFASRAPAVVRLDNRVVLPKIVPAMPFAAVVERGISTLQLSPADTQIPKQPFVPALQQGNFLSIVATINLTKDSGRIMYINQVHTAAIQPKVAGPQALIRLRNGDRGVIGEYPVEVRELSDQSDSIGRIAVVDAIIPDLKGTAAVELIYQGVILNTRLVSKNAPSIQSVHVASDTLAFNITRGSIFVNWAASDVDRDSLTYNVEVYDAKADKWQYIAVGLKKAQLWVTPEQARRYGPLKIRVTANDGFHSSEPMYFTEDIHQR